MKTINIIGGGKVGKTLGRLFIQNQALKVNALVSKSYATALEARHFVGEGLVVKNIADLPPADFFMLTVADDMIASCCKELAASKIVQAGDVVFHCSGAIPASILKPVQNQGAYVASLHPLKSFADIKMSIASFAGTYCSLEGCEEAYQALQKVFSRLGAVVVSFPTEHKLIYHASTVMASNYIVALMEVAIRGLQFSGITRPTAKKMLNPLLKYTVEQIIAGGTADAITGPIVRGDYQLVAKQINALEEWNPDEAQIYRLLGRVVLSLAENKINSKQKSRLNKILSPAHHPH